MFSSDIWHGSGDFYNGVATQSVRMAYETSSYFNINHSSTSPTNNSIGTLSFWLKRGRMDDGTGYHQYIIHNGTGTSNNGHMDLKIETSNKFSIGRYGDTAMHTLSRRVADTAAWYHIVVVFDSTSSTASERLIKFYINGEEVTYGTRDAIAQNDQFPWINAGENIYIGKHASVGRHFDGYLAEFNLIDGQALDPTYFGEFKNGVWVAKKYTGTYGNHGVRLEFNNTSVGSGSSSTVGADTSGQDNHWTSSGVYMQDCNIPDCPENSFAVLNPLVQTNGSTFSNIRQGNLHVVKTGLTYSYYQSTIGVKTGKWYAEYRPSSTITDPMIGVTNQNMETYRTGDSVDPHLTAGTIWYNGHSASSGYGHFDGSFVAASSFTGGVGYVAGDIIGVAIDMDSSPNTVAFYKNGSLVTTKNLTSNFNDHLTFAINVYNTNQMYVNFGQDDTFSGNYGSHATNTDGNGRGLFRYAVPSGYLALCTANMTDETHATIGPSQANQADDFFDVVAYTGNGGTLSVDGFKFKPDFLWIKSRNISGNHRLTDSSRGVSFNYITNADDAEKGDSDAEDIDSFDAPTAPGLADGGFTVTQASYDDFNDGSDTYVAWGWKANGGVDTATGSESGDNPAFNQQANPDCGFSIIKYVGTEANGTIAHGLNDSPEWMMLKNRTQAGNAIIIYHHNLDSPHQNYHMRMGSGSGANALSTSSTRFNNTAANTTVFTLGADSNINDDGENCIAYVWTEIEGYSKFGHYFGNSLASGAFVYTGFTPRYVMIKNTDRSADWRVTDTARQPVNDDGGHILLPNSNSSEVTAEYDMDILSNGFKLRSGDVYENGSAERIIYMAFAENPFKYTNAR